MVPCCPPRCYREVASKKLFQCFLSIQDLRALASCPSAQTAEAGQNPHPRLLGYLQFAGHHYWHWNSMLTASALRNDYHYEDDRLNMQNDTGWISMLETLKGELFFVAQACNRFSKIENALISWNAYRLKVNPFASPSTAIEQQRPGVAEVVDTLCFFGYMFASPSNGPFCERLKLLFWSYKFARSICARATSSLQLTRFDRFSDGERMMQTDRPHMTSLLRNGSERWSNHSSWTWCCFISCEVEWFKHTYYYKFTILLWSSILLYVVW